MKTFGIIAAIIGGLAVLTGLSILVKIVMFPVNTALKLIDTGYGAQNKILNADNAIYNYEWFKQQKEDIDALKKKIETTQLQADNFRVSAGERKNWTFEDKTEDARLQSIVTGLTNQLTQAIADYNARAKMANRNIFQNSILPDYIDALTFIKK